MKLPPVYVREVIIVSGKTIVFILGWAILISSGLIAKPEAAFACSCASPVSAEKQVKDELERKIAIFAGKVTKVIPPRQKEIMSSTDQIKVNFEVSKIWKGDLGKQTTVYTAMSSASCGYENFEVGSEYIVSAYKDPERLETNICDLTKPLASAVEELKILGEGYLPTAMSAEQKVMTNQEIETHGTVGKSPMSIIVAIAAAIIGGAIVTMVISRRRSGS